MKADPGVVAAAPRPLIGHTSRIGPSLHRVRRVAAVVAAGALALPAAALAQGPFGPLNDLLALGQGSGQTPDTVPTQRHAEPPLAATPRARCGPGAKPEPGIQGRVPAGSATNGLRCNVALVAHQGTAGGFKVLRYVDTQGHECAFYDTALVFPLNALRLSGDSLGVAVLDMSDPSHPRQTATLTELPMLSPHESLNLNPKRGLLAAVLGNPATYPGLVSIYDASRDCRHPVLQSTSLVARFGHESGFSPDGNTFYATGTALQSITAIDVTDPQAPHPVWQGNEIAHGMTLSDDGNRAYVADPTGGQLLILDTSQVQARRPDPQVSEVSRLTWKAASIPQNAIPFTENGHPYLLEIDEYTAGTLGRGSRDDVGAARIIDIANEKEPRVIADLRLQVNQPADHRAASGDPGMANPGQGYAAHYCNVPTQVDPKLVACSFIASGLRVFDISNLVAPREIAYFVAPTKPRVENAGGASDYAMSKPAFAPGRHEIWYSDATSGFYALRVDDAVWPASSASPSTACTSRKRFVVRVRLPKGTRVPTLHARLAGRRVPGTRVHASACRPARARPANRPADGPHPPARRSDRPGDALLPPLPPQALTPRHHREQFLRDDTRGEQAADVPSMTIAIRATSPTGARAPLVRPRVTANTPAPRMCWRSRPARRGPRRSGGGSPRCRRARAWRAAPVGGQDRAAR